METATVRCLAARIKAVYSGCWVGCVLATGSEWLFCSTAECECCVHIRPGFCLESFLLIVMKLKPYKSCSHFTHPKTEPKGEMPPCFSGECLLSVLFNLWMYRRVCWTADGNKSKILCLESFLLIIIMRLKLYKSVSHLCKIHFFWSSSLKTVYF